MKKVLLCLVLIIAFLFRFVSITQFPVGFNADEASFGYDAYSILHTARDQWGNFLPLTLKSFGDYKSPLYSYLTIPSIAVLGLNIFAVRLPNVIMGTLAVFAVYLLVSEIIKKKWAGILAGLLVAINPWAVMMSRGAFEANLITFFLPIGIYFFLKGLSKPKYLIWSALFLGLNLFTYHSAVLITPFVVLGLVVIYWKKIKALGVKKIIFPVLILLVFTSLTAYTFTVGGGTRISERSITQGALEEGAEEKIKLVESGFNPTFAKIFHNKYQVIAGRFVTNYLQYFSPKFLFTQGTADSYYGMFPGIGMIYAFDGLMILGLIPYFLGKDAKKPVFAVIAWVLISILPAALSTGAGYSGNRAEGMIPAIQILETFGLIGWLGVFSRYGRKFIYVFLILSGVLLANNIAGFIKTYTKAIPLSAYQQMLDGNLSVATWINQNEKSKNIIVSRSFSEPQIFFAFADKWDPLDYQKYSKGWDIGGANTSWVDQLTEYKLANYTIKSVDWKKDTKKGNVIIGRPEDFPKNIIPDKIFYYSNGVESLYVKNY